LDVSGAVGNFDTPDVGTGKAVTIAGLAITGADAGNYTLVQPTTTADITAASLTVAGITATSAEYDAATGAAIDASAAPRARVLPGDDVTLDASGATGSFDTKDVGPGKTVTIDGLTLSGAQAGNYVITPPTTTADITAATLTVTGITSTKAYD